MDGWMDVKCNHASLIAVHLQMPYRAFIHFFFLFFLHFSSWFQLFQTNCCFLLFGSWMFFSFKTVLHFYLLQNALFSLTSGLWIICLYENESETGPSPQLDFLCSGLTRTLSATYREHIELQPDSWQGLNRGQRSLSLNPGLACPWSSLGLTSFLSCSFSNVR